jgi:hypothetical protein
MIETALTVIPNEVCMKPIGVDNADDRIVVGYFSSGANASRAICELIDEGFRPAEIGAAFRSSAPAMEVTEGGRSRLFAEDSATAGSVGGPASQDEAVTSAGPAPGAGASFPSAAKPGPIPGAELSSTLRHELHHDLPSTLRHESEINRVPMPFTARAEAQAPDTQQSDEVRRDQMRRYFADSAESGNAKRGSGMKFGTGEGYLFPDYEYSESSFENSFLGMGLSVRDARGLSNELSCGGAIVSVAATSRASLAEGILERNHGVIRFESLVGGIPAGEGSRVEIYGRMRNYYRPEEGVRRKAS